MSSDLVLGGDFNFGYETEHWLDLRRAIPHFGEAAAPRGLNTYLASLDPGVDPFSIPEGDAFGKLDHLLASPQLEPVRGGLAFHEAHAVGGSVLRVSDHLGWETEFALAI